MNRDRLLTWLLPMPVLMWVYRRRHRDADAIYSEEQEQEQIEAMVLDPNLAAIGPSVHFDERCQALRTIGRCKRPADTFCLLCSLQVCSECRPEHLMLYVRQGAILTLTCDGRTME